MSTLTRRAILRGTPAAIAAAATITLPAIASASADADQAADLWRRYRANQVELYASFRQKWYALAAGDEDLHAAIDDRDQPLQDVEDVLSRAIEALPSNTPTAVAAKMNIAFDHADGFLCDLPWCMLAAALRSVLPDLPADMAEALAPLTKGQHTEIQVDEALWAGGTPKHFGDDVQPVDGRAAVEA